MWNRPPQCGTDPLNVDPLKSGIFSLLTKLCSSACVCFPIQSPERIHVHLISWQQDMFLQVNGIISSESVNLSRPASFAYDAVWSIALGLDAALGELARECGNGTDLASFDPLARDVERRDCIGTLLSNKIGETAFEGVSVSWKD